MADLVTAYATSVLAGREIASRLVRQACARHLDDLRQAQAKGLAWKPEKAQRAIEFFPDVLVLPERTDADEVVVDVRDEHGEPKPFVLQPWQQFIVGSLFGWYTSQGFRRFREALIETAKGSGKTPLCAGMLLYGLVADGELGAQCFMAATTREQAQIAFNDAKRMVEASPYLSAALDRKVNNLAVLETGSFLRAISAEKRGLDGKRVHMAMVDELHEAMPVVVNKMRAGTKGRRNALILKPTNSGFDRTSVLWQHHEYSRKVLEGTVQNESWFAFICGLDPCQSCLEAGRWFPDEGCKTCDDWKTEGPHWLKANPNLGVSLPWQYVRERVSQAKGMPSEVSDVLRFNFCVWTQGASRAVDMGQWAACQAMPGDDEIIGSPCYGGLDLGETDDFSAWTRIWLLDDDRVAVKTRYWIPQAAKERYPNRPYAEWERRGLLTITDGNETDYERVRADILEDCRNDGVIAIAYDPRSATETAQELTKAGIQMIKIPQGFGLHEAIRKTLELVSSGELCHGKEVILTWMASNVVLITGTKGDKRLAKEKAPEKIDGFSSLVNAVEWGIVRRDREAESVYLHRGVRTLGA